MGVQTRFGQKKFTTIGFLLFVIIGCIYLLNKYVDHLQIVVLHTAVVY